MTLSTTKEMIQITIQKIEEFIKIQEEIIEFRRKERKYSESKYKQLKMDKI